MLDIGIAIGIYMLAFFVHALLHRILLHFQKKSYIVTIVYLLFFPLLIFLLFQERYVLGSAAFMNERLIGTSIIFYILVSLMTSILYLPSVIEEGQVPARIILQAVDRENALKEKEIFSLFSQPLLIDIRLMSLQKARMVEKRGNIYFITLKGKIICYIVSVVTYLLGIPTGG